MATAPTTRRASAAADPDGRMTSATSATPTTMTATDTGRISVFQCGCSRSTRCSSSVSEGSRVIRHIVARARKPAHETIAVVDLARHVRRHWLFGLVLAAALVLRVLTSLAFRPIMWFGGDSASYLATGLRLIPDPARAGGYGFLLWVLRPLHSFALVAALQHLMGLAMGVLIYLLARRHGLPAWGATLATVPVLFDA